MEMERFLMSSEWGNNATNRDGCHNITWCFGGTKKTCWGATSHETHQQLSEQEARDDRHQGQGGKAGGGGY